MAEVFTGRESELRALEQVRREALTSPRMVTVYGGAGIGKTSLMREFAGRVRKKGFDVAWGRLNGYVNGSPYRVWTQAIAEWVRHGGADGRVAADLQRADGAVRTIGALVPEVGALAARLQIFPANAQGDAAASAGYATDRYPSREKIPSALATFVRTVVAARPTVVILDDLHLAAHPSIEVLRTIMEGPEVPLLVCITSRTALEIGLESPQRITSIELGRLTREDVGRLCRESSSKLAEEYVERVYEYTQGNPLLVEEASELIRIEGSGIFSRGSQDGSWERRMVERVQPLYRRRARPLSEEDRAVLFCSAALGSAIDKGKLAVCLPTVQATAIDRALESGVALGLLERGPDDGLRYRFPSLLGRESVLEIADSAERARIHGSIGRGLELHYGDGAVRHAVELQNHYLSSGDREGIRRGVDWGLAAGQGFIEGHDWESSLGIYNRLLVEYADYLDAAVAAEVRYGLGRSLVHSGRKMEAVGHLRAALEHFERCGDLERIVELARQIIAYEIGDVDYFAFVQRAMDVVPEDAQVYDSLAFFYGVGEMEALGDYTAAWATLSRQFERAGELHSQQLENAALTALAYMDVRRSRIDAAIAKCELVMERCRRHDDPFAFIHGRFVLMQAYLARRDTPAAMNYILGAKEPTIAMGNNLLIAGWYAMIVRFEIRAGRWAAARELCDEGLTYDARSPVLLPLKVSVEHETGNLEEGDRFLERLMQAVSAYPTGPYLVYASTALALMGRCCAYRDTRWLPVAREISEMLLNRECPPAVSIRALMTRGLIAICDRDRQLARDALRRLRAAPRLNLVRDYRVELVLARLAAFLGSHRAAYEHFGAALQDAESYPDRPALGWIHYYSGVTFLDTTPADESDVPAGMRHLRLALRIARELGMAPLHSMCRERLAGEKRQSGSGYRAKDEQPRKMPSDETDESSPVLSALSERELQVLRMLSEGMSDKEMAGILGLSVYTVSNHVRHILRKTDAANRVVAVNVARKAGAL